MTVPAWLILLLFEVHLGARPERQPRTVGGINCFQDKKVTETGSIKYPLAAPMPSPARSAFLGSLPSSPGERAASLRWALTLTCGRPATHPTYALYLWWVFPVWSWPWWLDRPAASSPFCCWACFSIFCSLSQWSFPSRHLSHRHCHPRPHRWGPWCSLRCTCRRNGAETRQWENYSTELKVLSDNSEDFAANTQDIGALTRKKCSWIKQSSEMCLKLVKNNPKTTHQDKPSHHWIDGSNTLHGTARAGVCSSKKKGCVIQVESLFEVSVSPTWKFVEFIVFQSLLGCKLMESSCVSTSHEACNS